MTDETSLPPKRWIRRFGGVLIFLLGLPFILWAAGAFWYDLPVPMVWRRIAAVLLLMALVFLSFPSHFKRRLVALGLFIGVVGWWFTLEPSNDRRWMPDVAKTAHAEVHGDEVTLHHVRNFDYHPDKEPTPVWETRTVRLSSITGVDMAINYWGSPYMAHPVVSFQFSDSPPVCFSIETRKEVGEEYSAIGGIYRQYELIYIVADERDVIRVRTNYRKGEDIYLYRLAISPEMARGRFMDYITALNQLEKNPRWYNALTMNCTTSIRTQHTSKQRMPWDWRILVNGKADEMMYEKRAFRTGGLDFQSLRRQSLINEAARQADTATDFSVRIRNTLPSFKENLTN